MRAEKGRNIQSQPFTVREMDNFEAKSWAGTWKQMEAVSTHSPAGCEEIFLAKWHRASSECPSQIFGSTLFLSAGEVPSIRVMSPVQIEQRERERMREVNSNSY